MAWIGDTHYEISAGPEGRLVRRLGSGELQVLGVRCRPEFASREAMSGVLYRAQWLAPGDAARAARFCDVVELREGGNCLHLACLHEGARQWWCYRPREQDDGTLSLLAEWAAGDMRARSRWRTLLPSSSSIATPASSPSFR
jgi:hypothetical protein